MPGRDGPVLIAYDGSPHAKAAIEQAGRQLNTPRPAVVLTVWQPPESLAFYTPWVPTRANLDETIADQAQRVADEGVELARQAGFAAVGYVASAAAVPERIVDAAEEHDAALIVLGSRGRSGARYALLGSVATAVAHHTLRPVFIARADD